LLVTTMNDPQEAERCKFAGANGTINKPIDRDELASELAKLLGIPARQSIRILVKVRIDGLHGTEFFIANTVDVSVSGLLFECDRELDLGEIVEASFFLPATNSYNRVVAKAEVVRSVVSEGTYRRYGVRFVEFKEGNSEIIAEFIFKKTGKS
ncbi:MAG TPA: PilZ domain-containing protein, partial [Nitrospirota bacterium]